jgi:hypothetical protein
MHGRLHTTTAAVAYYGAHTQLSYATQTTNLTTTPELSCVNMRQCALCPKAFLLRVGARKTENQAAKRLTKFS